MICLQSLVCGGGGGGGAKTPGGCNSPVGILAQMVAMAQWHRRSGYVQDLYYYPQRNRRSGGFGPVGAARHFPRHFDFRDVASEAGHGEMGLRGLGRGSGHDAHTSGSNKRRDEGPLTKGFPIPVLSCSILPIAVSASFQERRKPNM